MNFYVTVIIVLCIFLSWIGMIIGLNRHRKDIVRWSIVLFGCGLAGQGCVFVYRMLQYAKVIGYPWIYFINVPYDAAAFFLLITGGIYVWIVFRYRVVKYSFIYLPAHGCAVYAVHGLFSVTQVIPVHQLDLMYCIAAGIVYFSFACGMAAGCLGVLCLVNLFLRGRTKIKDRQTDISIEMEVASKIIQRLICLLLFFLVIGFFLHWIWSYRVYGVVWTWNKHFAMHGIIGLWYFLFMHEYADTGNTSLRSLLFPVAGIVIISFFFIIP